ncbi:MAG: fibro-slime domain-containing protein [Phycisphaerales bacterium]|nr:fibro-slime domain-containing protein [Phycisphaerales bacterium]
MPGHTGTGLAFDGDDHVSIPSDPALQITGDVTISGWFKLDAAFDSSAATSQIILERYASDEENTHIVLVGNDYGRAEVPKGTLVFKVEHGASGDDYRYKWTQRRSWDAGTWYHFAVVLNSDDAANNAILIDGVDDTDATDAGTVNAIDTDYVADMNIGGRDADYYQLSSPSYFVGVIDEVSIVDRALTEGDFLPAARHAFDWRITGQGGSIVVDGFAASRGAYGPGNDGQHLVLSSNSTSANVIDLAGATISGDVLAGPGADPATAIRLTGCSVDGVVGTIAEPYAMNPVEPPSGLGASVGDRVYNGGTTLLSGDLHCDVLRLTGGALLEIDGDVTILCADGLEVWYGSQIELRPGASVQLFTPSNVWIDHGATVNANTADPERFQIYGTIPDPTSAEPLNLLLARFPNIAAGFIDVEYDAAAETLTASGTAFQVDHDGDAATPAVPISGGSFDITATVDNTGRASSGNLTISGSIPGMGIPGPTLLTGEIGLYGSTGVGSGLNEFVFKTSGGDLADRFGPAAGVILSATACPGSYAADWDNLSGGTPGTGSAVASIAPGPHTLVVADGAEVHANTHAPLLHTRIDSADYYGSIVGHALDLSNGARYFVDVETYVPTCVTLADVEGTAGVSGPGGITSTETFHQWFRTTLGVNQAGAHAITLTRDFDGIYEFAATDFHPVDDRLLGNEGAAHNRRFTFAIEASFVYDECAEQYFELRGGDGQWLFVDGKLAIDLGGVASGAEQTVDVDRLGLFDGETYRVHLFYAQRDSGQTDFRIRTNIELIPDDKVDGLTAMFD